MLVASIASLRASLVRPAGLRLATRYAALALQAAPAAPPPQAAPSASQQQRGWSSSAHEASTDATEQQQQDKPERDGTVAGKAADVLDDAAGDAVSQLHPALVNFLNSGYLVSQGELRQRLMAVEWRNMRPLALRKGLATFEQWLAERGPSEGIEVSWEVMQRLYECPDDLSPLRDNPRARLLAHALIQHAVLKQQLATYQACSDTAKELANVVESGQRTGITTLAAGLRKLLPWPFK